MTKVSRRRTSKKGEDYEKAEVQCPEVCEHYNKFKDAVDQFDKHCLRENYSIEKSQVSKRWWMKLYWGLIDSVMVNAYILWEMVHGKTKRKDFMEKLMDGMLSYRDPRTYIGVFTRNTPEKAPAANRGSGAHCPERMLGNTRLVCHVCAANLVTERKAMAEAGHTTEYSKPRRTQYKCNQCQIPLCMNCFPRYHQDMEIEGLDVGSRRVPYRKNC